MIYLLHILNVSLMVIHLNVFNSDNIQRREPGCHCQETGCHLILIQTPLPFHTTVHINIVLNDATSNIICFGKSYEVIW